jgi:beta-1,2-mannobiose phosphorylase / 1,2-beta-oligomannan phosphorylase
VTAFVMRRLGKLMEPDPALPQEVEGVLNPAAARGPDGHLYLFPRVVAKGNYSRIGIARVQFGPDGDPVGVERLGYALEPETEYETWPDGRGGCEDARVAYVEPLGHYVMTYTAWSDKGPRIAIARSEDLLHWERLGPAKFTRYHDIELGGVDNKDACLFPTFINDPVGHPSVAMLHRPLFPGTRPEELVRSGTARPAAAECQTIWISYWHWTEEQNHYKPSGHRFAANRPLALPQFPWEALKIGAGTPPVLCRHGWLIVHHGVQEAPGSRPDHRQYIYSAGVMILDRDHPHRVLYRTPEPALFPSEPDELEGVVNGVVFPTGIDRRDDLGQPDRFDVYYGMGDDRIGVATFTVPETLPAPTAREMDCQAMHERRERAST